MVSSLFATWSAPDSLRGLPVPAMALQSRSDSAVAVCVSNLRVTRSQTGWQDRGLKYVAEALLADADSCRAGRARKDFADECMRD